MATPDFLPAATAEQILGWATKAGDRIVQRYERRIVELSRSDPGTAAPHIEHERQVALAALTLLDEIVNERINAAGALH